MTGLWIPGRPKTKGSLDFVPGRRCRCCSRCAAHLDGGFAKENVAGSGRWRKLMSYALGGGEAFEAGPVSVAGVFALPVEDVIAPRAGDLDKLARNLLDALQDAQVYRDDVQVSRLLLDKIPAGERGPGVAVRVWRDE